MHIDEEVILARSGLEVEKTTDAQQAVEQFQEEVFRKPYPIRSGNPAAPIRLYYIWTHDKPPHVTEVAPDGAERYKTEEQSFSVTYIERIRSLQPEAHRRSRDDRREPVHECEHELKTTSARFPSYEIDVVNGAFPVVNHVDWELDGRELRGQGVLTLSGQLECTVDIVLPRPTVDSGCHSRGGPQTRNYSLQARLIGANTEPSSNSYIPWVSWHDLSLAATAIRPVGEIKLEAITSAEFLMREYYEAYQEDVWAGYVQNGATDFTDIGNIVSQGLDNRAELKTLSQQQSIFLSTTLVDELSEQIYSEGVTKFLSLETQYLPYLPSDNSGQLDFDGPYGVYYQELFFHIPFLIAHHLNANQKFGEAKWWYERIFDPTASESPDQLQPQNRYWRYRKFRIGMDEAVTRLKDILEKRDVIEEYKRNPFNPHAIARLRPSAYQKAIVMRYIDNLLDWGDYLFAQDSMESINEATMLYVLAADILGKRPVKLGKCDAPKDWNLSYEWISAHLDTDSEFLIILENWILSTSLPGRAPQFTNLPNLGLFAENASKPNAFAGASAKGSTAPAITSDIRASDNIFLSSLAPYDKAAKEKARYRDEENRWNTLKPGSVYPNAGLSGQATLVVDHALVFCSPPNYDLLEYWDRVEDRLFKIRHCRNISGVRRQLALFQPAINPALLVRARAAGLSLEDILAMLAAPLPPYRFNYLIEKAKQFTQTVQNFGNSLLSALEKKDAEELTLLRSVHERNILRMTKEIKKQQCTEAQRQFQAMIETEANVQNRIKYYQDLVDEGLTGWEIAQQISKHLGTGLMVAETALRLSAGITYLLPQVGSPFAVKYGGKETGDSQLSFSEFISNLARISDAISASAGLEATFQRREQEWKQQLLLAQQELKQVEQQRLAAEVRQLIAEKDLEIHETNIDQADELNEFYKDKFTNLGLYNYLSTSLNRLYREAYNVAYDMGKTAERTYQFERDDETIFIAADNWQFDRAGLLAGERLLLQLQRMEKAFLETHTRDIEITQLFSLALLNPESLIDLRQTGSCDFAISEVAYDLFYPGQYKRIIKSARITIPCVTGPYTNTSAKLTLMNSYLRQQDNLTTDPLTSEHGVAFAKNTSITASSAQNDAGMFEFSFRDERYLPFEGAGAVSDWRLELPSTLRMFDYNTISDVIIHVSYTAKDDGRFKGEVEGALIEKLNTLAVDGLYRLISLKQEFPNAFHKLFIASEESQAIEFDLTRRHFPYFLADKEFDVLEASKKYSKHKDAPPIEAERLFVDIIASGSETSGMKWIVRVNLNGLDKEGLSDILILFKYMLSE